MAKIEVTIENGEVIECPNCGGTGDDPETMVCVMCGGTGRLGDDDEDATEEDHAEI